LHEVNLLFTRLVALFGARGVGAVAVPRRSKLRIRGRPDAAADEPAENSREMGTMRRVFRSSLVLTVPVLLLLVVGGAAGGSLRHDGRIVFVTNRYCLDSRGVEIDCGSGEIAVVNPDGSGLKVLTRGEQTEASPAWSPDGRLIAFFRQPRGRQLGQIWLMDAKGRHERQLTRFTQVSFYGDLAWVPDGTSIVFKAFPSREGGQTDLWMVNVKTGRVTRLTQTGYSEAAPSWSPDGRWIAFFTEGRLREYQIFRLSFTTRHAQQLTRGSSASMYPAWSPDSRRIAFTRGSRLALINADGSHLRVLRIHGVRPTWSPDGRWIAFSSAGDVFKAHPDGSGPQRLTHHAAHVVNDQPNW
jgi:Tol biopolymer transport system component